MTSSPECIRGHPQADARFDNTPDGWDKVLPTLTAEDQVAVEATSSAFSTDDRVLGRVDKVVVANPLAMRRLGSGRHTDRDDAERLATMLALGTLPAVWVPPHPIRELRRLLKARERMQNHITRLTNELRAALRSHGMDVDRRRADPGRVLCQEDVAALPAADRVILHGSGRVMGPLNRITICRSASRFMTR